LVERQLLYKIRECCRERLERLDQLQEEQSMGDFSQDESEEDLQAMMERERAQSVEAEKRLQVYVRLLAQINGADTDGMTPAEAANVLQVLLRTLSKTLSDEVSDRPPAEEEEHHPSKLKRMSKAFTHSLNVASFKHGKTKSKPHIPSFHQPQTGSAATSPTRPRESSISSASPTPLRPDSSSKGKVFKLFKSSKDDARETSSSGHHLGPPPQYLELRRRSVGTPTLPPRRPSLGDPNSNDNLPRATSDFSPRQVNGGGTPDNNDNHGKEVVAHLRPTAKEKIALRTPQKSISLGSLEHTIVVAGSQPDPDALNDV